MKLKHWMSMVWLAGISLLEAHPGHEVGDLDTAAGGLPEPKVQITEEGSQRVIHANGLPNHATGKFPNPGNPNAIQAQNYLFRVPLHPVTNAVFTPLERQPIGVAVNGVVFDPGTAEYWKNDPSSGWRKEGIVQGRGILGMDRNMAHVQPNGAYHYHGVPTGLVESLPGSGRKLIGYAADGFPITTQTSEDRSSYRLKSGHRPAGTSGPGGTYDGTYTQDYEFVAGSGTLDEANGRTGAPAEGVESSYFYVATEEFPFYPRQLKGTPDSSFERKGPGGRGGGQRQDSGSERGPGSGSAAPRGGDPISRFDRDGDGKISKEEAPPPMQRNFSKHDTNGDGFIDKEEAKSLPSRGGSSGSPGEGRNAAGTVDRDGASMENSAERKPWIENHISELDIDGNGQVSLEEMTTEVEKVFQGYDGNRDGMIAQAEASAGRVHSAMGGFLQQHFSELDTDHDGSVSLEELRQAAVRMWKKYSQNKGGPSGPPPN